MMFVLKKAEMIEKRHYVVDNWLCDSTQLIHVVANVISNITITKKIAGYNIHGTPKQSKNKLWFFFKRSEQLSSNPFYTDIAFYRIQ